MVQDLKREIEKAQKRIKELEKRLDAQKHACAPIQELQAKVFENAPGGMAIISHNSTILACNQAASDITGYSTEELHGSRTTPLYYNRNDQKKLSSMLSQGQPVVNYELPLKTSDGSIMWINLNANTIAYKGKPASLISFTDITSIRAARKKLKLDEVRFEMLYTISELVDRPESEILDFAIDAITKATGSEIGYIFFVNEDETELTLYAWSKTVMEQCNVEYIPNIFEVEKTKLWGDALRQRKPIFTNSYQDLPDKKGYPEGHVHIINHLNMPIFDSGRIVMLAGVGNKSEDYTDDDAKQLGLIMDGTWRIIQRKRADAALLEAHDQLEEKVRQRTVELETVNEELAILNMQLVKRDRDNERTRTALEESEQQFRTLFENNHLVMLIIDAEDGMIVDVNPAAVRFYGYERDTLLKMHIAAINVLSPEDVKVEMIKAVTEKRSFFSFQHKLANGDIRDVEVFSGPVIVQGKQLLYSIVHDVTERKRAEETLVRYERIISSTPDLISLVDRGHIYRIVNDSYLNIFNKTHDEIVGHHVSVITGKSYYESTVRERLEKALAGETITSESWMTVPGDKQIYYSTTYHPVSIDGDTIEYVSVESRDMTAMKKNEEALKAAADRLDMATSAGNIGIFEWDLITDEGVWDKKMYELYNVEPGEYDSVYEGWRARLHEDDLPKVEKLLVECIEQKTLYDTEFRLVWPNGEERCIKAAGYVQVDEEGAPIRMTGVNWDVTDQRRMENELRKLASTDPLTGASNRRHFMNRLNEELDRCKRYHTPLVLLSLDIDHFKDINDSYGHPSGDDVLKELVALCTNILRTTDVFGRVGGEEFLAALTQTSKVAGHRTAERLRSAIEHHVVQTHGHEVAFTISIGMTEVTKLDTGIESLLKRADEALYMAKNNGRNRVEVL